MLLVPAGSIPAMTPWQIIEEALGRRKPPRKPHWLAEQLGTTDQVLNNWKNRAVPPGRFRAIAEVLGLSVDQLEGLAPLPWEKETDWPFPGIEKARFERLETLQKGEIQGEVRKMIEMFESQRSSGLGKSSGSPGRANHQAAA